MKWLDKIDHVTYVVKRETIRKWAWLYIENFGGKLVLRVDDTNPGEPSSMMLWCIDFGEFGIALVAGIDRDEQSHVTAYVERHGDHSVQHVAYQVPDIARFRTAMEQKNGMQLLGPILQRHDGFGWIRQVFGKGYTADANSAVVGFPEFVERPLKKGEPFPEVSFSSQAGTELYKQAQQGMHDEEHDQFADFGRMPSSWDPGFPAPHAA